MLKPYLVMVCSLYHPLKRSWVFYPTSTLKDLFIYLGWAGSLLPHKPSLVSSEGYSLVAVHGLLLAVSSRCRTLALEHWLSCCGAWALLLHGMWELPGPGIEPISPDLPGRFLSTGPPGKSCTLLFFFLILVSI